MRRIEIVNISWSFAVGAVAGLGFAAGLSLSTTNVFAQAAQGAAPVPGTAAPAIAGTKPTIIDTEREPASPAPNAAQTPMQSQGGTPTATAMPAPAEPAPPAPTDQVAAQPGQPADAAPAVEPPMQAAAPQTPADGSAAATDAAPKPTRDAEGRAQFRYHPLQVARPDRNIVVCEAGCGGTRVVYDGSRSLPAGDVTPAAVVEQPIATCRGGCYPNAPGNTWAGYDPSRKPTPVSVNSVTAPKLLDGEGRWMSNVTPGIISAPPVATQPKAAKPKRDDWMARINRERDADKAAKAAAQ